MQARVLGSVVPAADPRFSPALLQQLSDMHAPIVRKLSPELAEQADVEKVVLDEKAFRWMLNEDAMATDKLSDGIRRFAADALALERMLLSKMAH